MSEEVRPARVGDMHTEPMIAVRDVRASAACYRELLGCTNDHDGDDSDALSDADP
jgi:hypothetical protein